MGLLYKHEGAYNPDYYREKRGKKKATCGGGGRMSDTGTSIFDPVLCEVSYSWFTAEGDTIIDPFAGGSVRGIVAAKMGRRYTGIDIREEQCEANNRNASEVDILVPPLWLCGDSKNIKQLAPGEYDFLFTCPPYGDLEKYSDNPKDLSNMDSNAFEEAYREILLNAVSLLREDRFASIVVGNYRDKKGFLIDLVGITVRAMEDAGAKYYNDAIFMTPVGSLPVRCIKPFKVARKLGKNHQYYLNFCKGDPKKATKRLGDVNITEIKSIINNGET